MKNKEIDNITKMLSDIHKLHFGSIATVDKDTLRAKLRAEILKSSMTKRPS